MQRVYYASFLNHYQFVSMSTSSPREGLKERPVIEFSSMGGPQFGVFLPSERPILKKIRLNYSWGLTNLCKNEE